MSPLKITLLLNLYTTFRPMQDYPPEQADAPAMQDAVKYFREHGIIHGDITFSDIRDGSTPPHRGYLTPAGLTLVRQITAINPGD